MTLIAITKNTNRTYIIPGYYMKMKFSKVSCNLLGSLLLKSTYMLYFMGNSRGEVHYTRIQFLVPFFLVPSK